MTRNSEVLTIGGDGQAPDKQQLFPDILVGHAHGKSDPVEELKALVLRDRVRLDRFGENAHGCLSRRRFAKVAEV